MTPARPFTRPVPPPAIPDGVVLVRKPTLLFGLVGALAVAAWAGGATWFVLARDDIAQQVFARRTEASYAYEDRIADLKNRLEREVTQNLVERNGFTARVDALATRQGEIEARQTRLLMLAERVRGGDPSRPDITLALPPGSATPGERSVPQGKPAPVPDLFGLQLRPSEPAGAQPPRDRLSALEGALGAIADRNLGLMEDIRRNALVRSARLRSALDATGLGRRRVSVEAGIGGPLVPVPPGLGEGPLGSIEAEVGMQVAEVTRLVALGRTLPLATPLRGEPDVTSPFGYRFDPFTRGPALHTGLDLRAEAGSLVRATAPGRVVSAEYAGGYGNMVEIDHGNGLTTRYGHLSAFLVAPGAPVEADQAIGRAGSTGRSTGAHLHYETRIDGEPVNPERFLEAGRSFRAAQAGF